MLVATSTLAWGVNTPTHLVVIKGTEFFDAPTKRCEVEMPSASFCFENFQRAHTARITWNP